MNRKLNCAKQVINDPDSNACLKDVTKISLKHFLDKVQKSGATAGTDGAAGVDRQSGELYLPERAHASVGPPPFEMSTDDDGRTCCNSRQNGVVQPLLTDLYQITMAYAYWKSGKMNDRAVFDLFFRKNPFQGEFTIFAGLEECIKFLNKFHYSNSDIKYLKSTMDPTVDQRFFDYLQSLTASNVTIYAIDEGSVVFPRVPLIRVEGPLIMVQLLETTLLTLVNYASLMATNAARYRMVAGKNITLLEFGLRRAQGPDGGLSASKYSYVGGFDGTSNVLAGKLFNIPVCGTHAHAYITSFTSISDLQGKTLAHKETGDVLDVLELACKHREDIANDFGALASQASNGELAALISYAVAFPERFTALVDTYDVKSIETSATGQAQVASLNVKNKLLTNGSNTHAQNGVRNNPFISEPTSQPHKNGFLRGELGELYVRSGLLNFCAVALALNDLGYKAVGIRIDSGDLAYLSNVARDIFEKIAVKYNIPWFAKLMICASNDINEETIISLNEQSHKIDCFGIGTHLVTCQRQPALGCVYKMVEINDEPRIKLSQEVGKVTIPGRKDAYRLYGSDGYALIDLLQKTTEEPPQVMQKVLCRHPFQQTKRANVTPSHVESLHKIYWKDGKLCQPLPTLQAVRNRVQESLNTLRNDHKRNLNPTPYKVAVSDTLYRFIDELWSQNAPIGELR
ncbi:PREDICTED: nicotinate phosphoribosyltransferase isoform X2 [Vollenhovia emeryi]|uniref:nicotinate phosphoribosyltransferase isoform X2 n=1 Tax=Vollenhovia emeryi TaxID=411798 RepID=UPI0005F434BF|nr:PREDICTED: nicotinate phosphoribosyltransferase isoform X2 [Vollenhovia emeryi]